jgi:hypothetical protein
MAQPVESSGSLALSLTKRGPRAAPFDHEDARVLPKTAHRKLAAAAVRSRPVKPAEVAQAWLFEGLLQAESADLYELAHRMSTAPDRQPDGNNRLPSPDLIQVRARIDEVHRLLQALRGRFGHPQPDADR